MKIFLLMVSILLAVDVALNVWIWMKMRKNHHMIEMRKNHHIEKYSRLRARAPARVPDWTDEEIQSAVDEARKKCAAELGKKKEPVYVFGETDDGDPAPNFN